MFEFESRIDISKMTNEEREIYKNYILGMKNLRTKIIEEDMTELSERWKTYKEESKLLSKTFGMACSLKQELEELMEYDDILDNIEEFDKEDDIF